MFIQLIISGIVAGSIYALVALAMSLTYKSSDESYNILKI